MSNHFRTVTLDIAGTDVEFEVEFYVEGWPTSDSYMEPGDAGEISVQDVYVAGNRVYDWCEAAFYSWNVVAARTPYCSRKHTKLGAALFGTPFYNYGPTAGPLGRRVAGFMPTEVRFTVNPETVLQALERECLENLMDYANDEPDYDYSM